MADRSISVQLKADVAQYMANMRRAGRATSDLERETLKAEKAFSDLEDAEGRVRVAQERLNEVQKNGKSTASQLAQAQENLASATRAYERAQRNAVIVGTEYVEKHHAIAGASDESAHAMGRFGSASDRVARRANVQFSLLATAIGAALPVASAAAAGALVGGVGLAFGAVGAIGLRNSEALRNSWSDLGDTLSNDVTADAVVLEDELVGAADQIGAAWDRLRPQVRDAMAGAQPLVRDFVGSVTDLAENAMPGFVTAIGNAGPAVSGFRSLVGGLGGTLGDFTAELSYSSHEAGVGLNNLGILIDEVLMGAAPILQTLTTLWAEHGEEVSVALGSILAVLSEVSGGALPLFSAGLTVATTVLSSALAVIEPIAPALGVMASAWLIASTAAKGMNAVAPVMNRARTAVEGFASSAGRASAAGGGIGRLGKMATGLVGTLGGPWGLALTAASVGLALFADNSAEAAADQNSLASALRDSNGEFDAQARSTLTGTEAYKTAAGSVEALGISHSRFVDALTEGGPKLEALRKELEAYVSEGTVMVDAGGAITKSQTDQAKSAAALLEQMGPLRDMVAGAAEDFERSASASDALDGSMRGSAPGADRLREAIGTLSDEVATVEDRVGALNDAWRELFGVELTLEEATAKWHESLDSLGDAIDEAKKGTGDWASALINADGSIDVTTEKGRELSASLIEQGETYRELAQTAYDTALQQGQSHRDAAQAARDALSDQRAEFIKTMRQMGLTEEQARTLADRYLSIPSDVQTLITAPGMASTLANVRSLYRAYSSIPRHVRTVIDVIAPGASTVMGMANAAARMMGGWYADGGLIPGYATGGLVGFPTGGRVHGPGGPRTDSIVAALSAGEFVVNAKATQDNLDLLRAINSGQVTTSGSSKSNVSGVRSVPMLSHGGGTTVVVNAPNYVGTPEELFRVVRREVSKSYGGNVQKAFGR